MVIIGDIYGCLFFRFFLFFYWAVNGFFFSLASSRQIWIVQIFIQMRSNSWVITQLSGKNCMTCQLNQVINLLFLYSIACGKLFSRVFYNLLYNLLSVSFSIYYVFSWCILFSSFIFSLLSWEFDWQENIITAQECWVSGKAVSLLITIWYIINCPKSN